MENIVAKGEIARFELLVFKKLSAAEASESIYMRERVKPVNIFYDIRPAVLQKRELTKQTYTNATERFSF